MAIASEHLVRVIHTPAGPRYVVRVPDPVCPMRGWRAFSVLAFGPNGDGDQRLTLYERIDDGPIIPDDRRAA